MKSWPQPAHKIRPFLDMVEFMDMFALQHSNVVGATKLLSRHGDETVRNLAIKLHTIIRSNWAAFQAASRTKLQSE